MFYYENDFEDGVVSCDFDGCAIESSVSGSFADCIAEIKDMDWRILKRGDD